jgi:heme/copper-type cytochrome/quinol oxidase subunit 3
MIRPLLTEIALFLTPFAVYAVFLWATRAAVFDPQSWSRPRLAWLTIAALVLLLGSFFVLAQFEHAPPGSTYVPAHVENGKLIPGEAK